MPDFGRVLDVRPDAGTSVVIADADDAERLAGVGGELAQIDNGGRLVARHELNSYGQVAVDDLVHAPLYLLHHLGRGLFRQLIVALALFPFDMRILRARATEHADHRLVQNMFRRMHAVCMGAIDTS